MNPLRLLLLLSLLGLGACRPALAPMGVVEQREQRVERFQLLVVFKGLEGIKRIPYKYNHLRMEMGKEVSASPPTYVLSIACTAQELDGFIAKLALEADIVSARRYE